MADPTTREAATRNPPRFPHPTHPGPADWVTFKDLIVRLYLDEGWTLKQVQSHLLNVFNFNATYVSSATMSLHGGQLPNTDSGMQETYVQQAVYALEHS